MSDVGGVLARVVAALDRADVPYMITGSVASASWGAPRATQDIDIVIAPVLGSLQRLLAEFPTEKYYVSREAALDAYGRESLFNVIDFETGWKIDLVMRKARPFSQTEFDRRIKETLFGQEVFVATAEDVLLAKLEWAKLGASERQLEDVAGILRRQELDREYIQKWIPQLGLEQQWTKALAMAAAT
jgi:hypothetical protein